MNEQPNNTGIGKSESNLKLTVWEALLAAIFVLFGTQLIGGIVSAPGFFYKDLNHITLPVGWFVGAMASIFLILLWKSIPWSIIHRMLKPKWNIFLLLLSIVLYFVTLPMVEYATFLMPTSGLNGLIDTWYKKFIDTFMMIFEYKIAAAITICILAPLFEEILLRGLIFQGMLNQKVNPWLAMFVSSALFGIVHLNPWQFVGALLMGMCFAFVYYRTKNLWYCIILHALNNTISTVFFFVNGESMDMEEMSVYDFEPIYLIASVILTILVGWFFYRKTQIRFD